MDYIECPVCEGHGYTNWRKVDGIARTCEYCSGRGYMPAPKTRADKIRVMKDEELAEILRRFADINEWAEWCRGFPECTKGLALEDDIPVERCRECVLRWLREVPDEERAGTETRPYKEEA